ncbi:MAG: polysaccharide deacetylase family protein [Lachnospiraceae bacterium]|nr:polysaccharide deacetylase family protein [Lachnospiraceae bacterium]
MKRIRMAVVILDVILGLLLLCVIVWRNAGVGQTKAASGSEVKWKEGIEPKRIALTFDDGPHPYYTEQLLDGLKERGVRATFFVTGEHASLHPEIIKRMWEEGHVIGNHTYSHMQLRQDNRDAFKKELQQTNKVLKELTGEDVVYVRPPYGAWDKELEKELNMIPVLWSVDPLDWCTENSQTVARRVKEKVKDNSIILLHDYFDTSVTAALQIVDELLEEGYEFVTVEEMIFG